MNYSSLICIWVVCQFANILDSYNLPVRIKPWPLISFKHSRIYNRFHLNCIYTTLISIFASRAAIRRSNFNVWTDRNRKLSEGLDWITDTGGVKLIWKSKLYITVGLFIRPSIRRSVVRKGALRHHQKVTHFEWNTHGRLVLWCAKTDVRSVCGDHELNEFPILGCQKRAPFFLPKSCPCHEVRWT
jgi:hypothetical protein